MRLSLVLAVLVYSMTLTDVAFGGLVEVNSSQYLRESGNPQAQYLEVTLDNAGEIRVSNVNLQDGYIELAASTDVLLNGSSLMQPFSLPTGGSAVFPLDAGTHYLEVTLRGKPGGGLKVSFYEDKPDAPDRGIGFEILDDGTVLHKKTGLIWHRNPNTPGRYDGVNNDSRLINIYVNEDVEYIHALNSGTFGSGSEQGNAGHDDWRIPSPSELNSLVAYDRGDDCISQTEEGLCLDFIMLSDSSGQGPHRFGDPFFINQEIRGRYSENNGFGICGSNTFASSKWKTDSIADAINRGGFCGDGRSCNRHVIDLTWGPYAINWYKPCIWPVRGGTPE